MVTKFILLRIALYKHVLKDVLLLRIILFFSLASTQALICLICHEKCYDLVFQQNERVKTLIAHVLSDFYYGPLMKIKKILRENNRCCAHLVLIGVSGMFYLATRRQWIII